MIRLGARFNRAARDLLCALGEGRRSVTGSVIRSWS